MKDNEEINFHTYLDEKGNFSRSEGWYRDEEDGKLYTFTFDKLTTSPVFVKFSYINKERLVLGCISISTKNVECGSRYDIPPNVKIIIENILHDAVIKAWNVGYRGNLTSQPFIYPIAKGDGDSKECASCGINGVSKEFSCFR